MTQAERGKRTADIGKGRSGSRWLILFAAFVGLAMVKGQSPRAEPMLLPRTVRFVPLSAEKIRQLGADWQPVRRTEFETLLRRSRPALNRPSEVEAPRITYEATFDGETLRAGRLSATIRRRSQTPSWWNLGRVNLAIAELRQRNHEVVWGTSAAGRVMARVTDDSLPITGSWMLVGERIGQRCRFDVRLIPATTSEIRLKLPLGYTLESSAGSVSGPHATAERQSRDWRIVISAAHSTVLTVIPPEPSRLEKPVVLLETDLSYVVRDDGLGIQFRAVPEILRKGIDGLTFQLPADVVVYSANYGGTTPLAFTTRKSGNSQRLRIAFPDPLLGRGRAIMVQAVAPVRLKRNWELPRFDATSAVFLQGQVHLRVERPLEFRSLTTDGMRQSTGVSLAQSGETLSFDCRRPDARTVVHVAPPDARSECHAVTHLDVVSDQWRATSEFTWTALGGPLYTLRCRAAAGWRIGRVQFVSSLHASAERTVTWTEQRVERDRRLLSFDVPGGLPAGESVTLRFTATRPARTRRRRLRWPVVAPMGVDRFDSVVVLPGGLLPTTARLPAGIHRLDVNDLPEFARKSKLWKTHSSAGGKVAILRTRSLSPGAPLILGRPEPSFDGSCWTWVESSAQVLRERIHIAIVPRGESVEAILVSFSRSGPPLQWKLHFNGSPDKLVSAIRLPAAQSAAWQLPADAELWQITLPQSTTKPFTLRAERHVAPGASTAIALPFLPQSRRFVGHVEVAATVGGSFQPDGDELFPIDDPSAVAPLRPAGKDIPQPRKTSKLWRYRSSRAALLVRHTANDGFVSRLPVDVELWSVLSASSGGIDAHRVTFRLPSEPRMSTFAFRLQEGSLRGVFLNGHVVDAIRMGSEWTVQSLPAATENMIEVRYTVPSNDVGWSTNRPITVPRILRPVSNFRGHLALPPHIHLAAGPSSVTVSPTTPRPGWGTRLFGPLARSPQSSIFNPLSNETWRQLIDPGEVRSDRIQPESAGEFNWAPAGWTVHTVVGIDVPDVVTVQLSNRERSRLWAWIGLLTCLIAGWMVRRAEVPKRRKIGSVWLSACLAAALFVPAEFAEFAGACLVGSLIATVLSRTLIRREPPREEGVSQVPLGSTVSYPRVITTGLILCGLPLLAGEVLPAFTQPPIRKSPDDASVNKDLDSNAVIVSADGDTPASGPIVYVHKKLLASLMAGAESVRPPRYVLQSAHYRVTAVGTRSADVTATYDVAIVEPNSTVTVQLPLLDAPLSGANACRVNGHVQPVRRDPAGRGFLVDVPPVSQTEPVPKILQDSREFVGAALGVAGTIGLPKPRLPLLPKMRRCRIEFHLQPRVETVQKVERLRFRIPRVVSGKLDFELPFDDRVIIAPGLSGPAVERGWFSQSLSGQLSPADLLELHWGDGATLTSRRPKLTADVRGLAEVGTTKIRIRYRVRYQVDSGSVNSVVWTVPQSWLLRSVTLPDAPVGRLAFRRLKRSGREQSRIRIDLPTARSKPFTLEGEFLVSVDQRQRDSKSGNPKTSSIGPAPSFPFRLSIPRLHEAATGVIAGVEESANRVAVSTNAENGVSVIPANQAAVRALDRAQIAEFRREFPGSRLPDYAYDVQQPTALDGRITPHVPRRTVRQLQTGRFDGERLQWTLTADVTIANAPAYRHDLVVDPRLNIDSVSVLEDGAPRLVRWGRVGNRVQLFLSDKTAARQKVVLEARMNAKLGDPLRLPDVRFLDAVVDSSQLLLSRDSHIDVAVADRGDWELFSRPASLEDNSNQIAAAGFQLPATARRNAVSPQVRPVARRETLSVRRLTVLRQAKQGGWTAECTLEFRDKSPPSVYVVMLPAEIAEAVVLANDFQMKREVRTGSGAVRLQLRPVLANGQVPPLTFRFPLAAPIAGRWNLRLPGPQSVGIQQDVLALLPGDAGVSVTSPADKVRPTEIPRWMSRRLGSPAAAVYRGRGSVWQLSPSVASSSQSGLKVSFLESCIWLGDDGHDRGCTQALVAAAGQAPLEFELPDGVALRSVRVNGRLVAIESRAKNSRLIVPLGSQPLDFVRLDWERKSATELHRFGRGGLAVPVPIAALQSPALLTIVPARQHALYRLSGMDPLDAVTFATQRIERLLEVVGSEASPSGAGGAALKSAARSYESLMAFLKSPAANGQSLDDELRQRLGRIDTALKQAGQRLGPVDVERPAGESAMTMLTFGPNTGGLVHGEQPSVGDDLKVRFWQIDRGLLAGLLATLVLLVSLPFARPLFRAEIGERLAHWEPVSWIILGTIWWLFLVPSFVGLLLFSVAVAKFVRSWQRRRADGNVIRLYDRSESRQRKADG